MTTVRDPVEFAADASFDVASYDYELPLDRIAQIPAEPRDSSRLMVLDRATGSIEHARFRDIGRFLREGDLLVANESRVMPARLRGHKAETGAAVEILLLEPHPEAGPTAWEVLVKPGRRLRAGHRVELSHGLTAEIGPTTPAGGRIVMLAADDRMDPALVHERIAQAGDMPLPPYITAKLSDPERYQTVYARTEGSAAAPTAGLHFTPELLRSLADQGIGFASVTLHVGIDTFRPVEVGDLRQHHMHSEAFSLSPETAQAVNATHAAGGRIVAVGSTSVRTLETVAQHGLPIKPFAGRTAIFIMPGFTFRITDVMITNYHLPRSTLLAMVSAFAGRERILAAYATAIAEGYRFFSFGDAMLIL